MDRTDGIGWRRRRNEAPCGAALAVLAGLTYAGTLGYEFVWDDSLSVERWLPRLTTWWSPFFPLRIPEFPYNYFRPLQLTSYLIDRATGGGATWTFHLTSITLHIVGTFLVFRAGLRLFEGYPTARLTALWAGILFAVHPIHTESVAWMGARPDPMVACFGLGALLAYQHRNWTVVQRSCAAAALVFLALLSKENGIAMLLLVPGSTVALQRRPQAHGQKGKKHAATPTDPWRAYVPFVLVAVVYAVLRSVAMRGAAPPRMPDDPLQSVIGALGTYLRLLVVPYPHNAFIADVPKDLGAVVAGGLILLAYVALVRRAWQSGQRPLAFSLVWILVTLAPSFGVINMYPTAPLAERYLYVPSIGFCWAFGAAVAAVCERGPRAAVIVQAGAAALTVVAVVATLNRNPDWRDNLTSWKDTAAKNPIDALPMRYYAIAALQGGDEAEARRAFEQALKLRNDRRGEKLIYNNLGMIAARQGDDVAAEDYYRKSLQAEVGPASLFNLALIFLGRATDPTKTPDAEKRTAEARQARELLERALVMSPRDADIHLALAHTAEATGDTREARRRFEQALELGLPAEIAATVRQRVERLR